MKFVKLIVFIIIFIFIFNLLKGVVVPAVDKAIVNIVHKKIDQNSRPETEKECLEKGGEWRRPGPWPKEVCMLKNKDGGKFCLAGFMCESGQCISYLKSLREIPSFAFGQCPKYKILFGCFQQVHFGLTGKSVCLD